MKGDAEQKVFGKQKEMKGKLKYIIIAAAGFIGLGIALIGIGKVLGGEIGMFGFSKKKVVVGKAVVSGMVDIDKFSELTVENSSTDFIITPGNEYRLDYCVYEGKEPIVTSENGKLRIEEPKVNINVTLGYSGERICYKLIVPTDNSFDAEVKTTSGDIEIDSCKISGLVASTSGGVEISSVNGSKLEVNTTSGGISVKEAEYSGDVSIKSTSGDINIENIECADLDTSSTSGECTIEVCKAAKYMHKSSSGSFEAKDIKTESINTNTTSGEIRISDAETGDVKAESSSGSIKIELDKFESVECEATSGNIELKLPGNKDDYSYDLKSNTGSIRVGGDKCEKLYKNERSGKKIEATATSGGIEVEF